MRSSRLWCAMLAPGLMLLCLGTACDEEAAGRAFRDAAASSVQTGLKSISDGIIDGLFAVVQLGDDGETSGDSSTTETTTGE